MLKAARKADDAEEELTKIIMSDSEDTTSDKDQSNRKIPPEYN